jgi:hypothetical protein
VDRHHHAIGEAMFHITIAWVGLEKQPLSERTRAGMERAARREAAGPAGRHQIIEQLRAVASVMDRVIVVSHHEDFHNRRLFPAGDVLRKDGRRTTVGRAI